MKKNPPPAPSSAGKHILAVVLLALLAFAPFGRELFSTHLVLSEPGTDIALHFLYSRIFGFGEIAQGNLPLWNPQIYGGIPYLGQFQSALLYPPNVIFLILPAATAINWSIALHVFLLGLGVYGWATFRKLLPSAAFVAACCAMFGGTFFLHIFAGHLSNVCAMAWAPFLFWGIDGWLSRRHVGWVFVAAAAAALQIYAGHPQYFYYGALVAGLYALAHLIGAPRPLVAAGGLIAIYPLAGLFAAAQLLPGMSAAGESVRSGGVNYEFASMFSLPPENVLTLFTPWVFGNMQDVPYWGRCYLWEMNLFAGVGMLLLAGIALSFPWEQRGRTRLLVVMGLILLLALGAHTPLHAILYKILPGFSGFRGSSKFIFFASILLAFCAGMGVDALWKGKKCPPWLALAALVLGGLFVAGALALRATGGVQTIQQAVGQILATKESYLNPVVLDNADLLKSFKAMSVRSLLIGGGSLGFFALLLWGSRRWLALTWVIAVCAILEIFLFARSTVKSTPLADLLYQPVQEFLNKTPGDFRVLNLFNADASMVFSKGNVWGYDPSVLKRYAQLLTLSQGVDPEQASQYLPFRQGHPILALVRGKAAMIPKADGQIEIAPLGEPFPRFLIVSKYEVLADSAARFSALGSTAFDFANTVVLEQDPIPRPEGLPGEFEVRQLSSSTDDCTLEVKTTRAALLVMTDAYAKGWKAESLPGSVQLNYDVLPADHALRAIPLAAGRHLLKIEYTPAGFGIGILISLVSILGASTALAIPSLRSRLLF